MALNPSTARVQGVGRRRAIAGLAVFSLLAGGAVACGGSSSPGVGASEDAGSDATLPDSAGPGPGADGASRDGAGGGDAQPDARGGADTGPNPGLVSCSGTDFTIPTEICCVVGDAGTCRNVAAQCTFGAEVRCDDKADCDAGFCCYENTSLDSRCISTCITGAPRYQACKTSAECETPGETCTTWTCNGGRVVRTCQKPLGLGCF